MLWSHKWTVGELTHWVKWVTFVHEILVTPPSESFYIAGPS